MSEITTAISFAESLVAGTFLGAITGLVLIWLLAKKTGARRPLHRELLDWWIIACTVALLFGGEMMILWLRIREGGFWGLLGLLSLGIGLVLGGLQWLVLRQLIRKAGWWVLSTTGSVIVSLLLAVLFAMAVALAGSYSNIGTLYQFHTMLFVLPWPALGITNGITQWLVLRKQVRRAGWWVLASIGSWIGGGVGSFLLARISRLLPLALTIGGAVVGVITGLVLFRLLRDVPARPVEESPSISKGGEEAYAA
jgi:hypothetical protein